MDELSKEVAIACSILIFVADWKVLSPCRSEVELRFYSFNQKEVAFPLWSSIKSVYLQCLMLH